MKLIGLWVINGVLLTSALPIYARYFPEIPATDTLYVINRSAMNNGEATMIASLQGVLAKTKPLIYVLEGNYARWLLDLSTNYNVTVIYTYANNPWGLIDKFHSKTNGYILYSLNDSTSVNAATSLAGIYNCVCVDSSIRSLAQSHSLSQYMNVSGEDEQWIFNNYWASFKHNLLIQQKEQIYDHLRDYAVATGAFTFYDGNSAFMNQVLDSLENDAPQLGWGNADSGEDKFIKPASERGVFTIPADMARNLSILSSFQPTLQQSTHSSPASQSGKHYVTFIMSDGDNLQWLLNSFTDTTWYGSGKRGNFSMGWTISPSLSELAPTVMKWLYTNASTGTNKDFFIAGVSGMGYFYSECYSDLETHTQRLNQTLSNSDLNIVAIMGYDYAASFNEDLFSTYMEQSNVIGGFYYDYCDYDSAKGKIIWASGKPVVGIRYSLWTGDMSVSQVVTGINALPKDPTSEDGYSAISVHAWSMTMDSVQAVIDQLSSDVVVVTPEELILLITQNLKPPYAYWTFPSDTEDWQGRTAGGQYDKAQWSGTVGNPPGSLMLDGSDFGTSDWKPNAWFKNNILLPESDTISLKFDVRGADATHGGAVRVRIFDAQGDSHIVSNWQSITGENWQVKTFDISQFSNQNIRIQLEQTDDDIGAGENIFIDNITITASVNIGTKEKSNIKNQNAKLEIQSNPFVQSTVINYQIPDKNEVSLKIYDLGGRLVRILVNKLQEAGTYSVRWNTQNIPKGIYFCQLKYRDVCITKKVGLIK